MTAAPSIASASAMRSLSGRRTGQSTTAMPAEVSASAIDNSTADESDVACAAAFIRYPPAPSNASPSSLKFASGPITSCARNKAARQRDANRKSFIDFSLERVVWLVLS